MYIGLLSYSIAAVFFLVLFGILLTDRRQGKPSRKYLLLATSVTFLWAASAVFQTGQTELLLAYQILEVLRNLFWQQFLLLVLGRAVAANELPPVIRYTKILLYLVSLLMILLILDRHLTQVFPILSRSVDPLIVGYLAQAVTVLVDRKSVV